MICTTMTVKLWSYVCIRKESIGLNEGTSAVFISLVFPLGSQSLL